jgi:cyclase
MTTTTGTAAGTGEGTGEGAGEGLVRAQEVAAGVFALLQPPGGWCLNNAGLIVGQDGNSVLIDTAATERRARHLRTEVGRLVPTPPRTLVNTHFHGDHVFGNYLFPEALIIAHEDTRADMAAHGLHLAGLWPQVCWGDIELALPHLTYRQALSLHIGGVDIELLHMGPAAHTTNDTVIWLPAQRVLFTGDVIMSGVTPFCVMGSLSGSLQALKRLRALDPLTVVPGHGPVGGPELIDANARYLHWLKHLAQRGAPGGLSALDLARQSDLGPYGELIDSERLVPNLARALAEERGAAPGEPLDIAALFEDMIHYHGRLPDCLA